MFQDIQSVLFPKNKFTKKLCRAWLSHHDLKLKKIHETENYYKFRQMSKKIFKSFSIKLLSNSIKLIIGYK